MVDLSLMLPAGLPEDYETEVASYPPIRDFSKAAKETNPEPPLVENLLHKGETMIISAPPKAGKTLLAMQLGLCVSTGTDWLGLKTERGAVLYLNLEVREKSFESRCAEMREAMGLSPDEGMFVYQTLNTFHCQSLEEFADCVYASLNSVAQPISLLIVDPFYMLGDSDENSVQGVRQTLFAFRQIVQDFGVSLVVVHHHSKSNQGSRSLVSRGSGSGALGRFFGSIADMMPVVYTSSTLEEQLMLTEPDSFSDMSTAELEDARAERLENAKGWSAWVIEAENREFAALPRIGIWFNYPCFYVDQTGELAHASYKHPGASGAQLDQGVDVRLNEAMSVLIDRGIAAPTYKQLGDVLGVKRDQVSKLVKKSTRYKSVKGEGRAYVVVPADAGAGADLV